MPLQPRKRKKGISLILTFLLPLPPFSYFLSREEATATAFHVDDTAQFRITMPQEDGRKGGGSPPLHTCQKRDSPTRSKKPTPLEAFYALAVSF